MHLNTGKYYPQYWQTKMLWGTDLLILQYIAENKYAVGRTILVMQKHDFILQWGL